jgi:hypothetical protein
MAYHRSGRMRSKRKSELKPINIIPPMENTMTSIEKIIEVAELMHKIDQQGCDTNEIEVFQDEVSNLGKDNTIVRVAFRLMKGVANCIKTDKLEIIERYRSLAKDLGATVDETGGAKAQSISVDMPDGRTAAAVMSITILPPEGSA